MKCLKKRGLIQMSECRCEGCYHYRWLNSGGHEKICHYIIDTEEPRGCPVSECDKKREGTILIGENLKRLLTEREMTQKELARAVGCSEQSLSEYALNKRQPKERMLRKMAFYLGVPLKELIKGAKVDE